ncbi:peptidylprolyl isomerase [Dissulfurispira thermophila]|uniref:peptidylprolyl isomerase n=1 Tax=Dissulfurispira thermophila TaxID=2715679 RepID=A0A7G1H0C6_9BACT|nr:peptidylprolyl isomerase [Dissulfurispira thermophila]BCB96008.1 peptidylprolyl isomerase [Dissulfurispira thermophila]
MTVLLILNFAISFAANDLKESKVVAIVNGAAITRADLDMEINRLLPQELYHRSVTPEKQAEIEKKAIENLINAELFFMEAKRQGFKIDNAEVKKRLDAVKASYQNKKAFEDALKRIGMTFAVFEEKVRQGMMVEKLIEKEVKLSLTDKDLEEYYKKNPEKFKEPEAVRLRYVYIKINPSEPDGKKKAKERAKEAYSKIKSGTDFAQIAQTYSNDMSRIKGGDVGFVHRGTIPQDIEKVAFALKAGQVSEILETDTGYHIIKVEEKRASRHVSFKEIKDKLKRELTESVQKERMEGLIKRLRENAKIQYVSNSG